jgi:LuxR family maltose regulon positive regulatory protein
LRAGLGEARACRDISVLIGHCVIATLDGREGHFAEAFAELAEAERLMHIWDVPPIYYLAMITLVKCELWLAQGRTDLAESWLLRLGQTYGGEQPAAAPEFHPLLPLHIELQQALLERIQLRTEASVQRLSGLVERGVASGGMLLAVSALCQWLALLLAEGRDAQAAGLLPKALEAAQGGVLQPFQPLLEKHPQWLHEQLAARSACPVQVELLKRLPPLPAVSSGSGEALSGRERAVLELIAQGCSNQQISERLFISLHTVKTHASHINSKLGVERRTQAVAKAKALGLLA